MTLVVGDDLDSPTSLNTVQIHKSNISHDTSSPFNSPNTRIRRAKICKTTRKPILHIVGTLEPSLTNTDDGSKLRLLVLISGVDRDGAQEDESQNGEEDERH